VRIAIAIDIPADSSRSPVTPKGKTDQGSKETPERRDSGHCASGVYCSVGGPWPQAQANPVSTSVSDSAMPSKGCRPVNSGSRKNISGDTHR